MSVSEKLGHAEPSITLNVYTHPNEDAQRRANEVLAEALYTNTKHAIGGFTNMDKNSKTYCRSEALKFKSLLTVVAGMDTDRAETLPKVVEVAKMAVYIAESLYCAIADGNMEVVKCFG